MADPGGGASEFAPAKVNLTLHVTGQRADGLHLLDSLVMFADIGDRLQARAAPASRLTVTGPMARGVPTDGRNLVLRAAREMGQDADFILEKHLPAAAGIGGGSSDAAAAMRALARLFGAPLPDRPEDLGADIPVCLLARAARMRGIGQAVEPLSGWPGLPALLVNPGVAVATGRVFAALERRDHDPMPDAIPEVVDVARAAAWLATQRNDLEAAAMVVQPVIGPVLAELRALPRALMARMSGSGATCFALFATPAEASAAAGRLRIAQPGWWVAATTLR